MDRYFFDKRVIKKNLIKYGIIFLIALPILIGINVGVKSLSFWGGVFIDVAVLLVIIVVCNIVFDKIQANKERKEQEELQKQKKIERARRRAKKNKSTPNRQKVEHKVENIEVITPDEK